MRNGAANKENNVEGPQRLKTEWPYDPAIYAQAYKYKNLKQSEILDGHAHCSLIHNIQMILIDRWVRKCGFPCSRTLLGLKGYNGHMLQCNEPWGHDTKSSNIQKIITITRRKDAWIPLMRYLISQTLRNSGDHLWLKTCLWLRLGDLQELSSAATKPPVNQLPLADMSAP